jgi:hypothetical protein
MPTIPLYNQPQVETRALSGSRQSSVASPSLFSAGADQQVALGNNLMQAGTQLNAIAVKLQERENADRLFQAETSLKDEYLKHEQSIRERKGQNAWGVTTETEKWFADQEKKHVEGLGNDVQRSLFKQQISRMRQSAMGTISTYESGERRRSIEESASASIVGSINMAAAAAAEGMGAPKTHDGLPARRNADGSHSTEVSITVTDPRINKGKPTNIPSLWGGEEVDEGTAVGNALKSGKSYGAFDSIEAAVAAAKARSEAGGFAPNPITGIKSDILKRVRVIATLNGWSPERKQMEEAKHLTNLHKQVIQAVIDKDPTRAREYYEANKEEINGAEREGVEKVLQVGGQKLLAQTFADEVDASGMGEAEAIAAARAKFSGEDEAAAVAEVKIRFAETQGARERAQRDASDTAWGVYARTGRVSAIPSSVLAALDGRDLAALKDHARVRAEGRAVKTDFGTYYDLRQMAVNDPEGFRKVDLRRYTGKLSGSDLQEMASLQTGKPKEIKDAATLTQQLSSTYDTLGWGASKREQKGAFDRAVTDAINTEQTRRGKELDYTERQAIIDRMAIEGDVNGMWPGGGRRFYEVQGKPEAAKFAPEIPATEKQQLVDRFTKRKGRAPSKDEINQIYKQWKGLEAGGAATPRAAGVDGNPNFERAAEMQERELERRQGKPLTSAQREVARSRLADKWGREGYDPRVFFAPKTFGGVFEVSTLVQDIVPGAIINNEEADQDHYLLRTPEKQRAAVEDAVTFVGTVLGEDFAVEPSMVDRAAQAVFGTPTDKTRETDRFYTQFVQPAEHTAKMIGMPSTPALWAAYALIRKKNERVSRANLEATMARIQGTN